MISHFALNNHNIYSNTSVSRNRPDALSSLMERSLGSTSNSLSASFLDSNEQLRREQQLALASLERSSLLSLQDQMKDAINSLSHSQSGVTKSQRSGQKRSAEALGPSPFSDDSLLLKKQEKLQNVLRQNHREVMANAALGLIAICCSQQHLNLQSGPLSIMEPLMHGNYAASYALKNAMPYLAEEEKMANFINMQHENELKNEIFQTYAQQDLYGSICTKIKEEKEDKQRQIEKLTQHEHLLLLLKKKQEEEQQQKIHEKLRHEQLYSLVQQRQLEEQQRELQLRMATMERLQQVGSEARGERSGSY
jgi:hypothetical protein